MEGRHTVELVRHPPPPALRGLVAGMVGLSERSPAVVRRRQPAGSVVPLVLAFGEPLVIDHLADGAGGGRTYGSFVAGLSGGHADTRFEGGQDCVQVYLTPLGVRRVLGVPGAEVARAVRPADDFGSELGTALVERLHGVPTWAERFRLVEDLLLRRVADTDGPAPWVSWMWWQIASSGGRARISELVAATGWSHRHVARVFAAEVGLTPKQASVLVRFERATAVLGSAPQAEIAARFGYTDQSHFARDVKRHAGETPGQLAAARRPTPVLAMGAGHLLHAREARTFR